MHNNIIMAMKDRVGNELKIGDKVVYCEDNTLSIGKIIGFTAKFVKIKGEYGYIDRKNPLKVAKYLDPDDVERQKKRDAFFKELNH